MKTLKQLLEKKADLPQLSAPVEPTSITAYVPKTKDEKRFMDKHVVKKTEDRNGNGDDHFRATNVKQHDRSKGHGYNTGEDQKVYESKSLSAILGERHMTPAEMKKREDIAQGIEKSNPDMPMSKKMAIATSKAMKEDADHLVESEEAHAQFQKYHDDTAKLLKHIHTGLSKHYDNVTHKKNFGGGQAHWGHVGDIKHIHRQLQDIHDNLLQTGEYAKPPKPLKEGYELFDVFEDGFREEVVTVFESLSEDHQQTMIEMIEAEDYDTVAEIVKEVVNG
jgi:hypothetical protein